MKLGWCNNKCIYNEKCRMHAKKYILEEQECQAKIM